MFSNVNCNRCEAGTLWAGTCSIQFCEASLIFPLPSTYLPMPAHANKYDSLDTMVSHANC